MSYVFQVDLKTKSPGQVIDEIFKDMLTRMRDGAQVENPNAVVSAEEVETKTRASQEAEVTEFCFGEDVVARKDREDVERALNLLAVKCWTLAEAKGFHRKNRTFAEEIALMHSELSEALEADRHGDLPSEKIGAYTGCEEELADLIIRALDSAVQHNLDVAGAIIDKMRYNLDRPYLHEKKC